MDDLLVVEPNQPDVVPVIREPVLIDVEEDPEEEEFKEEEEPQEKEDDMEVGIEEDKNEPELTYPYEETKHALVKNKRKAKNEYNGKLILDLGNEVRSSVEEETAAMENLVRKLGNAEEKAEWDLCLKKGRMRLSIFWVKMSVDAAIATEKAIHTNAGNNASGSGQARGLVTTHVVRECNFAKFMKCNPDNFRGTEGAVELRRWFEKTKMTFGISECAEDKKVKFATAIL
nr:reverse transcriptase domain-containing protein [Tanacetum cinerariifolium]